MSFRGIFMLMIAALLGGAAVFVARGWLEAQVPKPLIVSEKKGPAVELVTVVVARRDLFFGDKLVGDFVEETQWPAKLVPAGSFNSAKELLAQSRVVVRPIAKNEPILPAKLSGEGGRATLSSIVADDMRAVTIRVNDVLGVAGFVLPGDRVDILLTRELGKDNPITDIVLQNMKVLGIDQDANDESDKPKVVRTVTVEATPYQGQKLTLAAQVGSLTLSLRNHLDVQPAPQRTVTVADLGGSEINRSPNALVAGRNGAAKNGIEKNKVPDGMAKNGIDGVALTPAAAVASAAGKDEEDETETAEVVTTPLVDPWAYVTVLRGTESSQYKVRPGR
jgi:pilus assembly protein CpaB